MLNEPQVFKLPKAFYPTKNVSDTLFGRELLKSDNTTAAILVTGTVAYTVTVFVTGIIVT